jgi:hypothetical protein
VTSEARAILCALRIGLPVRPFAYSDRTWRLVCRYWRRYRLG